ncbi:MAG: hypothetical protein KF729_21935, partial [Sandaracinaceae bacterium]|nr:hypothetical protein [Sandaracinaceae bacterium]
CCVVFGLVLLSVLAAPPPPALHKPDAFAADVSAASWRRVASIERYRAVERAGFVEDRPSDAFDVASLGMAHHHDEQVLDHHRTEHYTEDVPYPDTETYTEQEQCGEDCTSTPQTCSETCSPDDNGFATCRTTCTGGGQSCTPRYCAVTRTRTVTRHRPEARTREVPVYRAEPRYAERFRWRVWRWATTATSWRRATCTRRPAGPATTPSPRPPPSPRASASAPPAARATP